MNAVVIATYNESLNAPHLVRLLKELYPELHIILVDDNSPDGTASIVENLGFDGITVLCRRHTRGYGTAVRDGLVAAVKLGAECVATMDADFSHNPKELGAMFSALEDANFVIGSRYVGGVRVLNWAAKRLLLSLWANFYVRTILGLTAQDCTSGYRAYRSDLLRKMKIKTLESNGYSFLVELLWRGKCRGARIAEVPIIFEERREGESKMNKSIIVESIMRPWMLRLRGRF